MRWLAMRVLALCLVMSALIGGVVLYGRAHAGPNPLHAYGLDICDGRPCFMGITPGVTPWGEAQAMIGELHDDDNTGAIVNHIHFYLDANPRTETQKVSLVSADTTVDNDLPPLGSFLTQYGTPCWIGVDLYADWLELDYPWMYVVVNVNGQNRVTPYSPTSYVGLLDPSVAFDTPRDLCNPLKPETVLTIPWLGLTSFKHYRAYGSALKLFIP